MTLVGVDISELSRGSCAELGKRKTHRDRAGVDRGIE
jgi:hypothetical protein